MPFPQAPASARRILIGKQRSGWLWCCRRSCWWCFRHMTKRSSLSNSGRGKKGACERRVQSRSTPFKGKPGSLWTCRPAQSSATTPRVCQRLPNCTKVSPHSSAHPGTLWCWLLRRLRRCKVALYGPHLKPHQRQYPLPETLFSSPWARPCYSWQSRFDFEGAGNGPVVITWIGSEHELYSSTCPISLVENCITLRHDRRLLSLLGCVHNWPTCRWSAIKKENRFSLNVNGIMSSFLERQFYRSTLYICKVFFWNLANWLYHVSHGRKNDKLDEPLKQ